MTELELRKETPTMRKTAVQPVPIFMFVGAHPFIRLCNKRVSEAIRDHISVCGTGVPVAQCIFFSMNKMNIILAGDAISISAPITPLGIAIAPSVAETGHSGNNTQRASTMVAPV